jgi:predicted HAD superfamily phosphohydrolase YqeG
MRKKKVENEAAKFKLEAIAKHKKGDKAGAALAMKKMKMREKEVVKLEGQEIIMEQ